MEQVEWAIATRFRGEEDLLVIPHVRVSSLDPVSDQEKELGCKVGIDATKPLGAEGFERPGIPISEQVRRLIDRYSKAL
jgi:3-polyprenyl-4-hydroxybenzoate decarboxylase